MFTAIDNDNIYKCRSLNRERWLLKDNYSIKEDGHCGYRRANGVDVYRGQNTLYDVEEK